jgi:hypothetical protein
MVQGGGKMPLVIGMSVALLLMGLAGLFVASARLIRRDMNDRFDKIRAQLEDDATAIVQQLPDEQG